MTLATFDAIPSVAGDFFDPEDGPRSPLLELLGAGSLEDFRRVADALFWRHLALTGLLLELHVEEPLVDLDARKACLLHGLFAHLAVPFASQSDV